ncbi:RNA polymerase factor sigma-54 [Endozoicomonas sp. ALB032]|uniref:RNA polymerase factor sigma-54 n=1 Tax=Endozoicomonas sp. ALB032 TaxID=3403082 RepID=UPI003BB64807
MKPSLQLKMGQQLTMTPQLQQAIRLLQLSTLDLQQEIQEVLESNPMLESEESVEEPPASGDEGEQPVDFNEKAEQPPEPEEPQWADSIPNDLPVDSGWDDVYSSLPAATDEEHDPFARSRANESLQDYLEWQLNLTPMTDRDRLMGLAVIEAINNDGYLTHSLEEIYLSLQEQVEELAFEELQVMQRRILHFDPVGCASANLKECLEVQLNQLPQETHFLKEARLLIQNHLQALGSRDYAQIMRRTRLKEHQLREALSLVQSLNPRPGSEIGQADTEYVTPDISVTKVRDRWAVDQLQEARWFLKNLQSRNETLLKVAGKIVEFQKDFLEQGEQAMKPLVLADIAQAVDMHESTISRVTTQKYMHTPRGVFELKYFFSSHVSTATGGECSSTAIRALIKKLVSDENPKKPLSDNKIAGLLGDQGIKVARRTIAKYRESMNIPPSNERKQLI